MPATRRSFLQGLGVGLGGAALLGARSAWGLQSTLPELESWHANSGAEGYKILEVFIQGGLSHQETLWMDDDDPSVFGNFSTPDWADIDSSLSGYSESSRPSLGSDHCFSRCVQGLYDQAGSQMRVVALKHDQPPHTAAVPLALGGLTIGRPRRAGVGSAVEALYGAPESPVSWILTNRRGEATAAHAAAYGQHGAASIPVTLNFGTDASTFIAEFADHRDADLDALWQYYRDAYSSKLAGSRSAGHDAYEAAASRLAAGTSIQNLLSGIDLQVTGTGWGGDVAENRVAGEAAFTRAQLQAAATLLDPAGADARYVCVVDTGVGRDYDVHEEVASSDGGVDLATYQAGSFWSVCDELTSLISAGTIDLETTLVVLNTEFGRYTKGSTHYGTDHHPEGYAALLIGGPIGVAGSSGLVGSMSGGDSDAEYTPTDLRAAMLLAAAVDPFDGDCLTTDETYLDNNSDLANHFFGVTS